MSQAGESIFREGAIDRLSSPEQLDHAIAIASPADWISGAVLALAVLALAIWGVTGQIPSRVEATGILTGSAGFLTAASTDAGGRLARIDVAVGETVRRGQVLAVLAQADLTDQEAAALAALEARGAELARLRAASADDAHAEAAFDAARREALRQAEGAADARAASLSREAATLEPLVRDRLETQDALERVRADLADARQHAADARDSRLELEADRLQHQERRARDLSAAALRVEEARREADRLRARLGRESVVTSPIDGRVTEIKASAGAMMGAGAPVAVLDAGEGPLQALVYLAPGEGKQVRPGMPVRLEPSTVRREEYGEMLGRVQSVSPYPATPQGMTSALQNPDLVDRFRRAGAPYAAVVELDQSAQTASGYRWSSRRGPPERLAAGTLVEAQVEIQRRRPVELLLPTLRRLGRGLAG